jgi:hypothetical protein
MEARRWKRICFGSTMSSGRRSSRFAGKPTGASKKRRPADFERDQAGAEGERKLPAWFPPEGKRGNEAGARGWLPPGRLPEGVWPPQDDRQSLCPLEAGNLAEDIRGGRRSFRAAGTSRVGESHGKAHPCASGGKGGRISAGPVFKGPVRRPRYRDSTNSILTEEFPMASSRSHISTSRS